MTVDFDRRLQGGGQLQHNRNHQQQSQYQQRPIPPTSSPSKLDNNYMATSATRVPLQPRLGGVTSSSGDAYLNRLSTLESSNNDNNKARLDSYSNANSSSNHLHGRFSEKDSSTLAQVNAPSASDSNHKKPVRSESVGRFSPRGRSSSLQRSSQPRSTSVSAAARDTDLENVVIEEKRRRANGDGYTLHRYLRGRLLGRGGFAKVYLCTALDTNKNYAVKIVPKTNLVKQRARQKLQAEIKIHRTLKHKHICEYKHFFEDRNNCYILLELCHNHSLNEMIKRRKRITEPEAALFMKHLLSAVEYLHENCVIHRDLKLGNLFLDRHIGVKVGDFGLATKLEHADEKRKTICGTPNYIAPEVIQGDKATRGHSFEVDIWSMGVILFTVLVGKPPYEAKDVKATYQRIIANEYSFPSHVNVSDEAKDLIVSMLQSKPEDRPTLEQIGKHPFLTCKGIPEILPSNATHVAPEWTMDLDGKLIATNDPDNDDRYSMSASSLSKVPKQPTNLPQGSSTRRVLGQRDPNIDGAGLADRLKKEKSERDVINVQGIVRNALSAANGNNSQAQATSIGKTNRLPSSRTPAASPFQIYDETTDSRTPRVQSISKGSFSTRSSASPATPDDLVAQTQALTMQGKSAPTSSERPHNFMRAQSVVSAISSAAASNVGSVATSTVHVENDANILHQMLGNLETVMSITEQRKGSYHGNTPKHVHRGGPKKWVTRYVDYTSKYGLGFLMNDGSSGVYFNDSSKTVLERDGEIFQYIERKKSEEPESPRNREAVVTTHSLSSYPDSLQKKVTLLKHFRNYLVEQQKKSEGDASLEPAGPDENFVFIKKWVRTKHAILFRLSNQTIQIVFYDQSEILLTPDERYITYVDKQCNRRTWNFDDTLVGNNPEFAKRLRYTREIMSQLLTGNRK